MNAAITVENISKRYRIGVNRNRGYRTLRESISNGIISGWTRLRAPRGSSDALSLESTTHWALKDVSLEVQPGEIVGIIGRNGAGKSTLLKVLSRITEPTSGRALLRGRVGSMLEVGTGFHQELTGRENVYLYGAILGMSRSETARKFDEIIEFAAVGRLLDSPVKRYSSGMYVRLAFAVAAHLEPDILLVDEVLSVGDHPFQAKSLAHMQRLREEGTTIVFVSHNMQTVSAMCTRCYVLSQGEIAFAGDTAEAVERYYKVSSTTAASQHRAGVGRGVMDKVIVGGAKIQRLQLINERGDAVEVLRSGDRVTCEMEVRFDENADNPIPACFIRTDQGLMIYDINTTSLSMTTGRYLEGTTHVFQWTLRCNLLPGRYHLGVDLAREDLTGYYDHIEYGLLFEVVGDSGARGIADLKGALNIKQLASLARAVSYSAKSESIGGRADGLR